MKKGKQKIAALLCTCIMANLVFPASAGKLEMSVKRSSKTQLSSESNLNAENKELSGNLTKEPEKTSTNSNAEQNKETPVKKLPVRMALSRNAAADTSDLKDAEIEVTGDCVYTGKKLTPEITVTLDGKELTKGNDYEVVYGKDVDGDAPQAIDKMKYNDNMNAGVGFGILQIKAANGNSNNITGTKYYSFDIEKATLTEDNFNNFTNLGFTINFQPTLANASDAAVYGNSLNNVHFANSSSARAWSWKKGSDISDTFLETLGKNTYTAICKLGNYGENSDTNFYDPKVEIEIDVQPRNLSSLSGSEKLIANTIDSNGQSFTPEYTGEDQTPKFNVQARLSRAEWYNLQEGTDYTIGEYKNNINAGDNTASVVIIGKGNYTGQIEKTFTISKADPLKFLEKDSRFSPDGVDGFTWSVPFGTSLSDIKTQLDGLTENSNGWNIKGLAGGSNQPGDDFIFEPNGRFYQYYIKYQSSNSNYKNYGISNTAYIYTKITTPRNINESSVTPTFSGITSGQTAIFPYTGQPVEPEITITDQLWGGTQTLPPDKTYDITYKNNTRPGTAIATITAKGVYTGTRTLTFEIKEVPSIAKAKITLPNETVGYTGSTHTPEPTVELGGKILKKGTDYTVSYEENTNPGAAYVTVTGTAQGELGYYGSKTVSFFILPPTNLTAQYGTLLTQISSLLPWFNTNWKWKDANAFVGNAGTQTPLANFNDGKTQKNNIPVTINVTAKPIDDSSISLQLPGAPFVYHPDHAITPKPVLVDETLNRTLVEGTDYTLAYANNNDAGTGTVTITGTGNYSGTRTKAFVINKADVELTVTDKNGRKLEADETINLMTRDSASAFTVTRRGDGAITYSDGNKGVFTAADAATGAASGVALTPTAPGNAILTIQVDATANYNSITATFPVVVSRIPISRTDIQITDPGPWTYNGSAFTPAITVTDTKLSSGNLLTVNTEYKLVYTDNINAGEAKITVTGLGDYEGSVIVPFTINKADYQAEPPARITAVYGQQLKELSLPKADPYDLFWTWKQPENEVGNVGEHTVDVYLAEGRNYHEKTASLTVAVEPKVLEDSMISLEYEEHEYTGRALEPSVTVTYRDRIVPESQYDISYVNNTERGTAAVTLTGKENFTGTVTKEFKIVEAAIRNEHIKLEENTWIYDGTQHTPAATVTVYGNILQKDTDYTVTYGENIHAGKEASVIITGQGNYTGTATVFFTIEKAVNPATPSNIRYQAVYGQKLEEIAVDGDWDWENPKDRVGNVGENEHPIFLAETLDYLKKTELAFVTVTTKTLTEDMVTMDELSLVYDGLEKRPVVYVDDKDALITADDYELQYENNLHAGTALVTVRAKGNYHGEVKKNFTIEKAQPILTVGTGLVLEKALRDGSFSLEAVLSNGESLSYSSSDPTVASVDAQGTVTLLAAGTTDLTVDYKGSQDYLPVQVTVKLTVTGRTTSSGGGSSSGGSRRSTTNIYDCVPTGYQGDTKIIGSARVPGYVETGSWNQDMDGSWKLMDANNQPVVNRWIAAYNPYANLSNGQSAFDWFRFDAEGRMLTGWFTDEDGEVYYLNPDSDCTKGRMVTGWYMIDGIWYYFETMPNGKRGRLLRRTVTPDGYSVDENGVWIQ